jgi:tetratricopeptide (TPR) repeat protein/transcriptional regulator with XRE-family HTH domain
MSRMEPEEVKLLVRLLRASRRWSQGQLGARAGVEPESILRFEKGTLRPADATVEHLVAAVGLPVDVALSVLPPVIRLLHCLMGSGGGAGASRSMPWGKETGLREEDLLGDLKTVSGAAFSVLTAAFLAQGSDGRGAGGEPAPADGRGRPTLAERLCGASIRAAARDAAEAVELARLAVRAAESAAGTVPWKARLAGWAHAFLANALRVCGQLLEAEAEWRKAWRLWQAGQNGDPEGRLPEWRLLDLEASLRRDQMRTTEALALLERARGRAPREVAGRLLINTAFALEQAGDIPGSLEALREAALLVGEDGDRRERWCVTFNLAVNLCHLGRYEEAQEWVETARNLASGLGNDLDSLRVTWLSARVDAGRGRREEARAALAAVRDELVARGDAVRAAVVSLELAVMDLEAGRTAEVKVLAREMASIFSAEGIERDALAALRLFWEAALHERATVAQAQELIGRLEGHKPLRWMNGD